MNELILKKLDVGKSAFGITPNAHGGGFPAACLQTSVDKVGGVIETTVLVDLAQGAGGGGTAGDIIGTDNVADAGGAYIAELTEAVNGVVFACEISCLEVPTGSDPDINVVFSATSDDAHDAAVTSGTVLVDEGDLTLGQSDKHAVGATIMAGGINALPYVYLTNGVATNAAYTAGKLVITFYGARF
tara:strand:+ start:673 stop:1233 length:561 start_codon:yes stop_codon:yes gene_type:complete